MRSDCQPEAWAIGKVIGLQLEEIFAPRWWYICKLDSPLGLTEEYLDSDLVPEIEIPALQAEWDTQAEAEDREPDVDDSLPEWVNYYANESGYMLAEYPESLNPNLAFDEF